MPSLRGSCEPARSCIDNLDSGTKFSLERSWLSSKAGMAEKRRPQMETVMPNGITKQHIVIVHGKPQTVILDRISKSSWIAAGVYNGKRIERPGSSWLLALSRWQEAALD